MRRRAVRARSCAAAAQSEERGDAFPRRPTIPGTGDDHCPSRRRNHRRWADSRPGQHPGHRSPVRSSSTRRTSRSSCGCATSSRRVRPINPGCRRSSPQYVRHQQVREGPALQGLLLQRRRRQPLARRRLDDDAGRGRAAPARSPTSPRRRRGQGRKADLRHQPTARPGLRRADRLAEHHRGADPRHREACAKVPVIVFDRGVTTDCPVTFIHPIGGYAFGADAAEFLVDNVKPGGNILALRILPGVDVLETRWSAAKVSSTEPASTSSASSSPMATRPRPSRSSPTTSTASARSTASGWMPVRPASAADRGVRGRRACDVPPITGEDQQDFLRKWKDDGA